MAITRRKKRDTRWLVRRGEVDYGPYTTEQLLEEIGQRNVDLGTLVCDVSTRKWDHAGAYTLFRDYYAQCEGRWEREAAHDEAERHERAMKAASAIKGGTWRLLLIGAVVVLGLGGWLVYRFVHVKPSGILDSVALAQPPALPEPPAVPTSWEGVRPIEPTEIAVLKERINYDTAGVRVAGVDGPAVQTLDFDGEGGTEIPAAELERITATARRGLTRCAQDAASRSSAFHGTRVGFTVRSRRLTGFTVGEEVRYNARFKACVKRSLRRIRVPSFSGGERRVSIPLRVRR
ncbi:MAG: hypothetical protein ACQEXJ_11245 [Myxococcota bacterium]